MINQNRQTGRTFRRLLSSLLSASEGKNVIFISRNHFQARANCTAAKRICDAYSINMLTSGTENQISLVGGGNIKFTYKESDQPKRIVIDDSYD